MQFTENIEHEDRRYAILPIKYNKIWEIYKTAQQLFWIEDEINKDLEDDLIHLPKIPEKVMHYLKYILGNFAVGDGLVNDNISKYITVRIGVREILFVLNIQKTIEDIHNITYSILVQTYVSNETERQKLLDSTRYYPSIQRKIQWVKKWLKHENETHRLSESARNALFQLEAMWFGLKQSESKDVEKLFAKLHTTRPPLAVQIFISAIMEGVFFSGSFCAIFWVVNTYKMLPGLAKANQHISRDEAIHRDTWVHIYNFHIEHKLSETDAHAIIQEAVNIETDFICEALPEGLLGMNSDLMTQYVKYVADDLLVDCGYKKYFNSVNPFSFMNKQTIPSRISDFFVRGVSEYGKAHSSNSADNRLNFDEVEYSDEED